MTDADARAVALVRAVEEIRPDLVPATMLVEAQLVAGDRAEPEAWLVRRARHLRDGVLARLAPLADSARLPLPTLGWMLRA